MSNRYISIDGTNYNPSEVDDDMTKIGESKRMGDGTLRYYHRTDKSRLTLKWNSIREIYVAAIRSMAFDNTTHTVIDYDGNTMTMMVLPGSWKRSVSAEQVDSAGVKRYNIELTFDEV
jgi:hypothetical protein